SIIILGRANVELTVVQQHQTVGPCTIILREFFRISIDANKSECKDLRVWGHLNIVAWVIRASGTWGWSKDDLLEQLIKSKTEIKVFPFTFAKHGFDETSDTQMWNDVKSHFDLRQIIFWHSAIGHPTIWALKFKEHAT